MSRGVIVLVGLVLTWQSLVWVTAVPRFILPGPTDVVSALLAHWRLLGWDAIVTGSEIVIGLGIGIALGLFTAILMHMLRSAELWMKPVLVLSQALPVFALAPLLKLWLGFGMAPKITMAILIIYFPVTFTFFDGLQRAAPRFATLAHTMTAQPGDPAGRAARWRVLLFVTIPMALPALASGIRVAAAAAPIGAVVGEWVGSRDGLGRRMLQADSMANTDLMFAALLCLIALALGLYFMVDAVLRRLVYWASGVSGVAGR